MRTIPTTNFCHFEKENIQLGDDEHTNNKMLSILKNRVLGDASHPNSDNFKFEKVFYWGIRKKTKRYILDF